MSLRAAGWRVRIALSLFLALPAMAAPGPVAVIDQPRPSGYFVGDLITQRVLLESAGHAVVPASLPNAGRVNAWFERRNVSIETDTSSRRWLVVQYQVLNAPPKLKTVTLPAWVLALKSPVPLKIPATSINVAPLSLPGSPAQVGVADLRPDHLPALVATAPIRRAFVTSSGALALTLAAWCAWIIWRNRRATATQPFARALREMRVLEDREPRTWQALHHAFDRTAGQVIQSATLQELFERAPQLASVRPKIERFFVQSNLLFFATASTSGDSLPGPAGEAISPRALCAELRRIERRHER